MIGFSPVYWFFFWLCLVNPYQQLLLCSQLHLWGSLFLVKILRMWPFFKPAIEVVTFCLHGWCMLGGFVASIHPSRTWMSGPFESVGWNVCVHRPDLGLCSHQKELYQWTKNLVAGGYSAWCWLPGSVQGLVGLVAVCCNLVRYQVWPAVSVSVWHCVQLCKQVWPWDTLGVA